MEYCSGGDLEEMVRKRGSLEASLIRNILFQMCFSLYACRERIAMRHYDIKLLNFFCTDRLSVSSNAADIVSKSGSTDLCTTLHFGFGDSIFNISIGTADNVDRPDVVKLADFGTSIIGVDSLGSPIGVQQVISFACMLVMGFIFCPIVYNTGEHSTGVPFSRVSRQRSIFC